MVCLKLIYESNGFRCADVRHNAGVMSTFGGLHIAFDYVLLLRLHANVVRHLHRQSVPSL